MAIASLFSDNPRIRDVKTRQYFVQLAKSYIDKECQSPNISVVHALSILGSFHASQGDQTLGYMYFGECNGILTVKDGAHLFASKEWPVALVQHVRTPC
jgi:hypothetical protein